MWSGFVIQYDETAFEKHVWQAEGQRDVFSMEPGEESEAARKEELRMIVEMIEAFMALAVKKAKHPLTDGYACIVCTEKRKQMIRGPEPEWEHRL